MDENNVRLLLHDIANTTEPAPRIDIDRARRVGLRRLWVRRVAIPAVAAVAVAAAIAVPHALSGSAAGHVGLSPATSGNSKTAVPAKPKAETVPATAGHQSPDGYLNPLVPYAAFGWLPAGYSPDITPSALKWGFQSTLDNLTITAAQSTGGYYIQLSVMPKDGCYGLLNGIPGWTAPQSQAQRCGETTDQETGQAPDIDGRPAYWGDGGTVLAWQYAPDSWAELQADSSSAQAGTSINAGFPASQAETLLPEIAARVKFGQTQPIAFPFRLSQSLPVGWHPVTVTYAVSNGKYLGIELGVGPYADWEEHGTAALSFAAAATAKTNSFIGACTPQTYNYVPAPGQPAETTSYPEKDGVTWLLVQPSGKPETSSSTIFPLNQDVGSLCNQQPLNGFYVNAIAHAEIPGYTQLGGITGVLGHLEILGTNPASYTPTPITTQ